jgi:hypothetical protein
MSHNPRPTRSLGRMFASEMFPSGLPCTRSPRQVVASFLKIAKGVAHRWLETRTLLDRAACAMAAVESPAAHPALGGGMLPAEHGAVTVCPRCKGKGYQPHRFSRETLVKAVQMRQHRAKKG